MLMLRAVRPCLFPGRFGERFSGIAETAMPHRHDGCGEAMPRTPSVLLLPDFPAYVIKRPRYSQTQTMVIKSTPEAPPKK